MSETESDLQEDSIDENINDNTSKGVITLGEGNSSDDDEDELIPKTNDPGKSKPVDTQYEEKFVVSSSDEEDRPKKKKNTKKSRGTDSQNTRKKASSSQSLDAELLDELGIGKLVYKEKKDDSEIQRLCDEILTNLDHAYETDIKSNTDRNNCSLERVKALKQLDKQTTNEDLLLCLKQNNLFHLLLKYLLPTSDSSMPPLYSIRYLVIQILNKYDKVDSEDLNVRLGSISLISAIEQQPEIRKKPDCPLSILCQKLIEKWKRKSTGADEQNPAQDKNFKNTLMDSARALQKTYDSDNKLDGMLDQLRKTSVYRPIQRLPENFVERPKLKKKKI